MDGDERLSERAGTERDRGMNPIEQATSSILVAGAGLVGAVAALSLSERGYQVTLIDRSPPKAGISAFDTDVRNVALSPRSAALIHDLDAWPEQAAPYHRMRVWEERGSSALDFDAASVNRDELGWLVEVGPLLNRLWEKLEAKDNIQVLLGMTKGVNLSRDGILLTLDQLEAGKEGTIEAGADFLIACDGARSAVREALDLPLRHWRTGQMALTTVVRTQNPHSHTAWQRFLLDGPLALLPSKDPHLCSIVWSQSQANAEARVCLTDAEFCRVLTRASEGCLGECSSGAATGIPAESAAGSDSLSQ